MPLLSPVTPNFDDRIRNNAKAGQVRVVYASRTDRVEQG